MDGSSNQHDGQPRNGRLAALSLAALGVVYGDIGTSPLYAIRECFHGKYGLPVDAQNVLGVLSLITWSLIVVVSFKYLSLVLRADNHGEGGVLVLTALVAGGLGRKVGSRGGLLAFGLFGAALLYGDGMITPAISVLSATEGLQLTLPVFAHLAVPTTIAILIGLFMFQRRGTSAVGALFGPVMVAWFLVLAVTGLAGIVKDPRVLSAINPQYGVSFLLRNRLHGYLVLGAVFLTVTGAEALYADLGHFGPRPIRMTWFVFVLPALLLNYFGQGALLLISHGTGIHPFFALVPHWALLPLVLLATVATIIASQAVISGAFSLTSQAIQLGYLPRMRIIHTSESVPGQIYVPAVNWVLMIIAILLVIGFRSSDRLAAAYGVAVTMTMFITTLLLYRVMRDRWQWNPWAAGGLALVLLVVDLAFLGANLAKIAHGAWFPLAIGLIIHVIMRTWRQGRQFLAARLIERSQPIPEFLEHIKANPPLRVAGKAVYMAGNQAGVPPALLSMLEHGKILHEKVAILTIVTENTPRVERELKVSVRDLGLGFYRVKAHFGFMEAPAVPYIMALAEEKGLPFKLAETSFFLGRERLLPDRKVGLSLWRASLFAFLSRNATGATAFYHLPADQVLEVGIQVKV